ncbi:hypothetical protein P8452_75087 [Trifolium repens]|nr:hypothetical protein P8452_75087 [Trifolium repens]
MINWTVSMFGFRRTMLSREEIVEITMAFNLVKHIVPYLYNPSIFKALYMNWRFLMLKWFKEKHATPFLITFEIYLFMVERE